jgi:hypothetical protein
MRHNGIFYKDDSRSKTLRAITEFFFPKWPMLYLKEPPRAWAINGRGFFLDKA